MSVKFVVNSTTVNACADLPKWWQFFRKQAYFR